MQSFHLICVKLKKTVRKRATWFCNPCKAEAKTTIELASQGEMETEENPQQEDE